jgi:hypothetical protein
MKDRLQRPKMGMPPARAQDVAENRDTPSGDLYCKKGRPPARAGGMAF